MFHTDVGECCIHVNHAGDCVVFTTKSVTYFCALCLAHGRTIRAARNAQWEGEISDHPPPKKNSFLIGILTVFNSYISVFKL